MNIKTENNNLIIDIPITECSLRDTLDCGQCFRFKEENGVFKGVAGNRFLAVSQTEGEITFYNTTKADFESFWANYFDFDTDYQKMRDWLSQDETLAKAIEFASGIHILKQDSFEAVISFIISQNNNIPRIKGSVERLCRKFGKQLDENIYAFPEPQELFGKTKEDFADLGLGYRDEYIADCIKKLETHEIDFDAIKSMTVDEARASLRTIKGIGPKVAECALLFGFYQTEAFPVDTWVKKVLARYYPNGFPEEYKPICGIAQQFLFHYIRNAAPSIVNEGS